MPKPSKKSNASIKRQSSDKFLLALGKFIEAFARAEQMLNYVVLYYSQMPLPLARAVLLPLRADASIQLIKRIVIARNLRGPRIDELLEILVHVDAIRDIRNAVVHYRITAAPLITNRPWARNRKAIWSQSVTMKNLGQMTIDLDECSVRLTARHVGIKLTSLSRSQRDGVSDRTFLWAFRFAFRGKPSWLYKPRVRRSTRRNRRHQRVRAP